MLDLEFLWILKGIGRMFREPLAFFDEIKDKELNFTIPVVFLILMGICLGFVSYAKLPTEATEGTSEDIVNNSIDRIRSVWLTKAESFLYPVWALLFWILFVIFFSTFLRWNNGWGEFRGIFNCTSFMIYYNFLVALVWVIFTYFIPQFVFVAYIFQVIASILNYIMIIEIARGAGQLPMSHALFTGTIPVFFFTLLWFSYRYILRLFIMPT